MPCLKFCLLSTKYAKYTEDKMWILFVLTCFVSVSSCVQSRWPASREVSWPPRWPTGAFVQSQASACWAPKLCATPWVSCTPAACTTSPASLPSTWVWRASQLTVLSAHLHRRAPPSSPGGLTCQIWGFRCRSPGGPQRHGRDVLVSTLRPEWKQRAWNSLLSGDWSSRLYRSTLSPLLIKMWWTRSWCLASTFTTMTIWDTSRRNTTPGEHPDTTT